MTDSLPDDKTAPRYDLLGAAGDFPDWPGPPTRCILVCTTYRSGSNLLGEALREMGGFGCPLEYFDQGLRPGIQARWEAEDQNSYLAALYRHRTDPTGTFGAKLDWPRFLALCIERDPALAPLREVNLLEFPEREEEILRPVWDTVQALFPNPRFIFLTRRDKLRQAVSWVRARQTSQFWGIKEATRQADPEPSYDYDRILLSLAQFAYSEQCLERLLAWAGVQPVRVVYEQLAADYAGTVRRVAEELDGRTKISVSPPRLQRQSGTVSEQWIKRFLLEHLSKECQASQV